MTLKNDWPDMVENPSGYAIANRAWRFEQWVRTNNNMYGNFSWLDMPEGKDDGKYAAEKYEDGLIAFAWQTGETTALLSSADEAMAWAVSQGGN